MSKGNYYNSQLKFYFCKEKPNVHQEGLKELTQGSKLYYMKKNEYNPYHSYNIFFDLDPDLDRNKISLDKIYKSLDLLRKEQGVPVLEFESIILKEKFTTTSGVEVINQKGKVEIKKEGETLVFQEALTNFYEPDLTPLAHDLMNPTSKSLQKFQEKYRNLANIGKQELQRLKGSTILAVYGVFKDKNWNGKNSIIWGLAEDKVTKKRFHWITDLEHDISSLFKKKE